MTEPIEHRCRIDVDGVETCEEYSARRRAIDQAEQLGLPTVGLERQLDLHLRGLRLGDEVER